MSIDLKLTWKPSIREPRREDVDNIKLLRQAVASKDASIQALQEQTSALQKKQQLLQNELHLKEDAYTKTLANGGAGLGILSVGQARTAEQAMLNAMLASQQQQQKQQQGRSRSGSQKPRR